MINRQALLSDLQKLLKRLEADLLERSASAEVPAVEVALRAEYDRAKSAARTAQNYEDWRTDAITQAAAAWVLSCVFVRFLEDNRLIDPPKIAGPGDRLQRARDEHELYFREHPTETDREYLLSIFDQMAQLPGTKDIFGAHNPIRELPNWLSGDAAGELLEFFQRIDANTGLLSHDFTDPNWDTRFLGDLYQDLSEAARKKYALLQTPKFVEEFILDRTLDPALDEFGLVVSGQQSAVSDQGGKSESRSLNADSYFKLIDPACGSGHFLLGAFRRILDRWQRQEPGTNVRELVQRTLDSIYGVDVNPYAVAIARFRLLLAAMRACGVKRLADAPGFRLNLACGDSLLHGAGEQQTFGWRDTDHVTQAEDLAELRRILRPGTYHAVVANPPYITPKDRALNTAYRERYSACHRQYSLAVPFMQRLFQLALRGDGNGRAAGYTGQITANSFMKREFGSKLIESFLPTVDLTHVIDTSGAYIPGHGTPTVILFGQNRVPVASTLRTVMGIRGEPATPDDPAQGLVWSAIVAQVDQPGSQSEFVSAGESAREQFHKHPWSIGGGGAAELKEQLDEYAQLMLSDVVDEVGFLVITGEDNCLLLPKEVVRRGSLEHFMPLADGEMIRDWRCDTDLVALWPNSKLGERLPPQQINRHLDFLWSYRTSLKERRAFGVPVEQKGIPWWCLRELYADRLHTPLSIAFAFVATHNHFVLDRGGKVFKQSAPVIKLPPDASEDDHLSLLGLLNSSTACFWMKQIFHDKGSTVDAHGARQTTVAFENFREFTGTGMLKFPVPTVSAPVFARRLDALSASRQRSLPASILRSDALTKEDLNRGRISADEQLGQMIATQEELDWECYRLYKLVDEQLTTPEPPSLRLGQRAFEIVIARKVAAGETETTWFDRHGSTAITELPAEWPDGYRQLVERRIELIENDPNIRLIEQPEYKRRWNTEPWESQLERALSEWLLDRLESYFDFDGRMNDAGQPTAKLDVELASVARLADIARQDAEFLQVGELYRDDGAFDVEALVAELVVAESVPLLPVLRYKPSGLIKRGTWERTWDLQRQEDAIDARTKLPATDPAYLTEDAARNLKQANVGDIPVPTKYTSADFLKSDYWRLRGKLDVSKERWISFPHCEGPDGTPVVCWAGYDHLQQARAISAYYVRVQTEFGGTDDPRLIPLLACLIELLPWLKQWHNAPDANYDGLRMGDYFEGFVQEEARTLPRADGGTGWTLEEIKAWVPVKTSGKRRKTTTKAKSTPAE